MPICEKCGRDFRGKSTVCRLCEIEQQELQEITSALDDSGNYRAYKDTMILPCFYDHCPSCKQPVSEPRTCDGCGSIQLMCRCGAVNFFHPLRDEVYNNDPVLISLYLCPKCGSWQYHCPLCLHPISGAAAWCSFCEQYVFMSYVHHLVYDLKVELNWISEFELADDLHKQGQRIRLDDSPNWGFCLAAEEDLSLESALRILNTSMDIRTLIDFEEEQNYRPFTILLNEVNNIYQEVDSFGEWISGFARYAFTEDPSLRNVLANQQAQINHDAAFSRIIDGLEKLVDVHIAAVRFGELCLHKATGAFLGQHMDWMRQYIISCKDEDEVDFSATNLARFKSLISACFSAYGKDGEANRVRFEFGL